MTQGRPQECAAVGYCYGGLPLGGGYLGGVPPQSIFGRQRGRKALRRFVVLPRHVKKISFLRLQLDRGPQEVWRVGWAAPLALGRAS
jgi:hypothetical protein